jgi:membrane protease YdiL (CAAX protease family)
LTEPAAPDPATAVPRLATFSLEGRAVPALYLVGWIGSVMGLAIILVSLLATSGVAAAWLFLGGDVVLAIGLVAAGGSQAIERGRRTELAYRGPSPVLAFLAVFAVTIIATVAVLAPLSAIGLDAGSPAATTIQLTITMFAYIGIIRLLVVGPGSLSWAEMHVTRPGAAAVRDLLIGALLALPVLVVALTLAAVVGRFVTPAPSPLPPATNVTGLVLNLISAAIIAPIGEELFFRGFATTAWAKTEAPARAIVRGAVFFAVAHVVALFDATFEAGAQRALYSFIVLLPVGIALGWVFLARRSVYASIGLHATFNAIQVIALVAATGLS